MVPKGPHGAKWNPVNESIVRLNGSEDFSGWSQACSIKWQFKFKEEKVRKRPQPKTSKIAIVIACTVLTSCGKDQLPTVTDTDTGQYTPPNKFEDSLPPENTNLGVPQVQEQETPIEENEEGITDDSYLDTDVDSYSIGKEYHGAHVVNLNGFLKETFNGRRLKTIVFYGHSGFQNLEAQLLINGHPAGFAKFGINRGQKGYPIYIKANNLWGQEIRSLQLSLNGPCFLDRIGFQFQRAIGPKNQFLKAPVFQKLKGYNILKIRSLLNLGVSDVGTKMQYVTLTAKTKACKGTAQLRVNGQSIGPAKRIDCFMNTYRFPLGIEKRIGPLGVRTIQIELNGNFTVKTVGAKLKRAH
jgi:hypothetical protein